MSSLQLAPYIGSRDYARLAELAKTQSLICIVDFRERRDVARTHYHSRGQEEFWAVGARGISYLDAFTREEFIKLCEQGNVEFIEPPTAA